MIGKEGDKMIAVLKTQIFINFQYFIAAGDKT